MSFEEFQDGHRGGHFVYLNRTILPILSNWTTNFGLNQTQGSEADEFKDFQDGHHGCNLGDWNGMILAILNLYVASMPSIKFLLNQSYSLGGDVI